MKLKNEIAEMILETELQIKVKFGIKIGYSHPAGCFLGEDDDFVIVQEGTYDPTICDFNYGAVYIIEYNQYEHIQHGIFVHLTTELNQRNERIDDFLIDFHQWIKTGKIKVEKEREFEDEDGNLWKWKPAGDGRFFVSRIMGIWRAGYCRKLEEFDKSDEPLRNHISSIYRS